MGIISGAAKAGTWALDKLGLDWVTGDAPLPGAVSEIDIFINVPDYQNDFATVPDRSHGGNLILYVPNHSKEFGAIAKNMAQATLAQIELVIALQNIIAPNGGLNVKDQLDPYHFEVIKESLEENGDEVPEEVIKPEANVFQQLGGAITETGALSALGTAYDAMETAGYGLTFLEFTPRTAVGIAAAIFPAGSILDGIQPAVAEGNGTTTGWPDYTFQLKIINSCVSIQSQLNSYAVSLFRNAIDTEAGALLLKNGMAEFSQTISENARTRARPDAERKPFIEPEAPGGFL